MSDRFQWARPGECGQLLPVKFQRDLHLPGRVHLRIHYAECVAIEVEVPSPELGPVEQIERLPTQVKPGLLHDGKCLCKAYVLVQARKRAHFGVIACGVAETIN